MDLLNRSLALLATEVLIFFFPSEARTSTTHSVPAGSKMTSGVAPGVLVSALLGNRLKQPVASRVDCRRRVRVEGGDLGF